MKAHLPKPLRLLLFAAMFAVEAGYAEDNIAWTTEDGDQEYVSDPLEVPGAVKADNITLATGHMGSGATNGQNLTIQGTMTVDGNSNVAVYGNGNTFWIQVPLTNGTCGDLLIGSVDNPADVVGSGNWLLVGSYGGEKVTTSGGNITVGNIYRNANILAAAIPTESVEIDFDNPDDEGVITWQFTGVQGNIKAGDIEGDNNQLLARGSVTTGKITGNGNIIAGATDFVGDYYGTGEVHLTEGFADVETTTDRGEAMDITTGSVAGDSNTIEASKNVTVEGDLTGEGNTVKAGNDVTVTGDAELNGGRIEAGQSIALQGDTQLGTGVLKVGDSQEVRSKEGESATLSGIKLTKDSLTATGEGENRGSISGADITAKGLTTISRIDISDSNILLSLKAGTTLTLSDVSIGQSTTFTDSNGSASRATVKDSSLELTQVTVVPAADNNTAAASTSFDMGRVSVSGKLTLNLTQELMSVLVANGVNYAGGIPTLTVSLTNIGNASELGRDNFAVTNLSNQYSTPSIGSVTVNGNNATVVVIFDPVVPEPATATLSLLALAGLCARRRRK